MATAPRSTAAFDELLATLAEARDNYVLSAERGHNELEAVEGYRYLLHMISESIDLIVDTDPERPRFTCMVSPSRKYLGDNPDSIYYQATIRDDRAYRIKGRKDHQTYVSFTVHAVMRWCAKFPDVMNIAFGALPYLGPELLQRLVRR